MAEQRSNDRVFTPLFRPKGEGEFQSLLPNRPSEFEPLKEYLAERQAIALDQEDHELHFEAGIAKVKILADTLATRETALALVSAMGNVPYEDRIKVSEILKVEALVADLLARVKHEQVGSTKIDGLLAELDKVRDEGKKDVLTGALTRRMFEFVADEINKKIVKSRDPRETETMQPVSVLFLDMDKFKNINDTIGHAAGDKALQLFIDLIQGNEQTGISSAISKTDHLFRYGGEEFAVFLYGCNLEDARKVAERIRENVQNQLAGLLSQEGFNLTDREQITVSIGAAQLEGQDEIREVVGLADKCAYNSKETGRNKVSTPENLPSE